MKCFPIPPPPILSSRQTFLVTPVMQSKLPSYRRTYVRLFFSSHTQNEMNLCLWSSLVRRHWKQQNAKIENDRPSVFPLNLKRRKSNESFGFSSCFIPPLYARVCPAWFGPFSAICIFATFLPVLCHILHNILDHSWNWRGRKSVLSSAFSKSR